MLWSTWLQHENGPARPVRYHTLAEHTRGVTNSSVAFHTVNESSRGSFCPPSLHVLTITSSIPPPHILLIIPAQKADNALVSPLGLRLPTAVPDVISNESEQTSTVIIHFQKRPQLGGRPDGWLERTPATLWVAVSMLRPHR
ncbi:hypothetical protein EVAR_96275_1 [Eumeta japonica]|uniref:Uncharacterized protein n=1 Tax=Eumeta variegata TaxID=151549 RepID=A0A4C1WNN8_EUMVA|nr:hypothetical protein EVAR_96275_1 [Eumeta japonica]